MCLCMCVCVCVKQNMNITGIVHYFVTTPHGSFCLSQTDIQDAAAFRSDLDLYDPCFLLPLFSHLLATGELDVSFLVGAVTGVSLAV